MNENDVIEIAKLAIWTACEVSGPTIVATIIVGLVVALFQALTQIQEMTLTFVPKIVVAFSVLYLSSSFVGSKVMAFTLFVYERAEKGVN